MSITESRLMKIFGKEVFNEFLKGEKLMEENL